MNRVIILLFASFFASNAYSCERPWVFFDLGQTLVDTKNNTFEKMSYTPEAQRYLQHLRDLGFTLGLIANWPENEGENEIEKRARLREFLAKGWDQEAKPFDWSLFDTRAIFLPNVQAEAKPRPVLFERARILAAKHGCSAVFQGESPVEVKAAARVGLRSFLVGQTPEFFAPVGWLMAPRFFPQMGFFLPLMP